ncbi:uncharacterized protein LOC142590710 isoform X2 [Dermacentor variabilis]|uniref:uncharacterized protein LOC142590710 isoform X2 n=1 Tax=Dermacentor variabilis TaxID=34621 RepID=UPI003F5B41A2
MSLNTAHAPGGVLIFKGEFILLYCDGVELTFEGPDAHQFHGTRKGRIYLTTHRMVFTSSNSKDFLQSFSFPFFTMSNLGLEQPIFGANYIKGIVKAEQNASQHANGMAPPPYFPPPGPYYCPPPPAYRPEHGADYGFNIPYNVFPDAPPANSVFMSDMPPPYPGVNGPPQYYPGGYPAGAPPSYPNGAMPPNGPAPAPGFNVPQAGGYSGPPPTQPAGPYQSAGAMAKAVEASQSSAYYNPANPGYMYVPAAPPPSFDQANASAPPQPEGPPPPYSEGSKKTN